MGGSPSGLGSDPFPVEDLLRRKVNFTVKEQGFRTAQREFYLTTKNSYRIQTWARTNEDALAHKILL